MAVKIGSSGAASGLGATGGGAALRGRGDDEGNFGRWANIVVGSRTTRSSRASVQAYPIFRHRHISRQLKSFLSHLYMPEQPTNSQIN
jgi:hypothetical protein